MRTRRGHRTTTTLFRLAAAVPPAIISALFNNLSRILALTGMVGIAIAFIVPAVLSLYAFAKERAVFLALSRAVGRHAARRGKHARGEAEARRSPGTAKEEAGAGAADVTSAAAALGLQQEPDASTLLDEPAPASEVAAVGELELVAGPSSGEQAAVASEDDNEDLRAVYEEATAAPVTLRAALTRTAVDRALASTPYSSCLSAGRWRVAEVLLVLSAALFVFVAVAIVQSIL